MSAAERAAIFDSMDARVAALHTVDDAALGLADYGKPGNFFARRIGRRTAQYRASMTDPGEPQGPRSGRCRLAAHRAKHGAHRANPQPSSLSVTR